jgi:hypothetical protein
MGHDTVPVFVIGSGRSGTRALYKALSTFADVEAHHEYCCTHIQPVAAKYFMGRSSKVEVLKALSRLHGAAVSLSTERLWVDTSNKLTWVVEPLTELFPTARFVNLIRDGRKVALSYVRKLGNEMYDDRSVATLTQWLDDPSAQEPPPEKRYWWNIPQLGQPFHATFPNFSHLERSTYHWVESNRIARESLKCFVPETQQMTLRLEDLVTSDALQRELLSFLGLEWASHFSAALSRPENVIVPIDFAMTGDEISQFAAIAGAEMRHLGYDMEVPEYRVRY